MRIFGLLLLIAAFVGPASAKTTFVAGAGGVPLSVTEVGDDTRPGILFLHGIGQGAASFAPQFESALAQKFHLVAFDLRGHGESGKPWDESAYADTKVWAEDVVRVMEATHLKRPVIMSWSYGTGVAADYIRANGTANIAGLVMVGALGGYVPQSAPAGPLPPELEQARELQRSAKLSDHTAAVRLVVPMLTAKPAPAAWTEQAVLLGTLVPAYAQAGLRKHPMNNQDLARQLTIPVLVMYGAHDGSVPADALAMLLRQVPTARAIRFDDAGHSPFVEDTSRFNAELSAFVDRAAAAKASP